MPPQKRPKKPYAQPTPKELEQLVVDLAHKTNLGPHRLAAYLKRSCGITLSPFTIRNILRRFGIRCRKRKTLNGNRRYVADLSAFLPLQFWQIDAKYVADLTTLPSHAYVAIFKSKLPLYQFTAIETKTRLRFIAYAYSLSFQNGLCFFLLLEAWLRAFGVNRHLFFQTDNGQEFGGPALPQTKNLQQTFIFDHLNVSLLNIAPRQKRLIAPSNDHTASMTKNQLRINLSKCHRSKFLFINMAQLWILHYNYQRPHFGSNMQGKTSLEALKSYRLGCHPAIGAMPVLILDHLAKYLPYLFDTTKIPWDNSPKNFKEIERNYGLSTAH